MVGQEFSVPSYSMVSLLQQPTTEDSDEELEYAENKSGTMEFPSNVHYTPCAITLAFGYLRTFIYW